MKLLTSILLTALLLGPSLYTPAQSKSNTIKSYYAGWAEKNWDKINNLLANGFTFTSPHGDDHLSAVQFKDRCWEQAQHIRKFEFPKIIEGTDDAFVTYYCYTNDGSSFKNTEYFIFSNGKIKSIEVFFGTVRGFPTNKQ